MNNQPDKKKGNFRNRIRMFRRKRLAPAWQVMKWPVVGGLWVFSFILGFIGFGIVAEAANDGSTFLDLLYRSLQLIVIESGDVVGEVPWQLETARFLMPLLAAYAAIQALMAIFSKQLLMLKLRFISHHSVVCGLGERGMRLAKELSDYGYRVVIIEKDPQNPLSEQCRRLGMFVLIGNATSVSLLRRARVNKAKYLITVCPDDGINAEIALKARDLVRHREGKVLTAYVHIEDLELCNSLSSWGLAADKTDAFRMEFFNVLESGARYMLRQHPPFCEKVETDDKQPRMLIVGLGKMGRSLVVQVARNWWINHKNSGKRLSITVIDNNAEAKMTLLRVRFPQLDTVCEFDIRQMEKNAPEFDRGDFLFDNQGRCNVDIIYICFDDDVHVLVNALTLHRKTRQYKVPIVMRMNEDAGLAVFLKEDPEAFDADQLHVFSLLDATCKMEALLGGTHEILAQAIHEEYVMHLKKTGETPEANPSMVDWDELSEDLKESNRHQAAHIEVKLKAIGCGIQPLTDWKTVSFEFMPKEIERLAKMEHERWYEERHRQGWSYNPWLKNVTKKTSPHLVPWQELSEEIKEFDRNMVRGLPSFLAQAGFQIYRRV